MWPQEEIEMLAPSANRILAHALREGLLGWMLSLALIVEASAAESLPANIRACTAETDRERRLDCFDREVARFPDARPTSRTQPAAPVAPSTPAAPAPQHAANTPAPNAATTSASSPTADTTTTQTNTTKPNHNTTQHNNNKHAPNE